MASSQQFLPFSTCEGLLTTVAQLPQKYKIRYFAQSVETPLDLSVKPISPQAAIEIPITPPPSPPKKRYRDDYFSDESISSASKLIKITNQTIHQKETTPNKPVKFTSVQRTSKVHPVCTKEKKTKAVRKLKFDEDTSSPVSGTIIRPLDEISSNSEDQSGDIDPQYNIVEVTEEAKAELAAIKNVIGAYVCKLCRIGFEDAFGLARHRCSCIVLLEYRCPECGKRFNCPANLASHRRWHKPKEVNVKKQQENCENEQQFPCEDCGKTFKRQAYLRKHLLTHKIQKEKSEDSFKSSFTFKTDESNSLESSCTSQPYGFQHSKQFKYESDIESQSDCSSPGRLKIVENLTEEENIAAAALAHLRNGPSVIQHTTAAIAI